MSSAEQATDAMFLAEAIRQFVHGALAGRPPGVQGAVLADLVATWLAGHQGPNAEDLRAELMALHIRLVLDLVPINESMFRDLRKGLQ